jgi:uncharacterized membrane protein YeaQ/YmgE (transglycosylase-associated protein family)
MCHLFFRGYTYSGGVYRRLNISSETIVDGIIALIINTVIGAQIGSFVGNWKKLSKAGKIGMLIGIGAGIVFSLYFPLNYRYINWRLLSPIIFLFPHPRFGIRIIQIIIMAIVGALIGSFVAKLLTKKK